MDGVAAAFGSEREAVARRHRANRDLNVADGLGVQNGGRRGEVDEPEVGRRRGSVGEGEGAVERQRQQERAVLLRDAAACRRPASAPRVVVPRAPARQQQAHEQRPARAAPRYPGPAPEHAHARPHHESRRDVPAREFHQRGGATGGVSL